MNVPLADLVVTGARHWVGLAGAGASGHRQDPPAGLRLRVAGGRHQRQFAEEAEAVSNRTGTHLPTIHHDANDPTRSHEQRRRR
ncbi:MAG TPA: hypothetical protein VFM01_19360 [Nakamurella sp.]|nr:hypothetical protein [Nakamurella sp.]